MEYHPRENLGEGYGVGFIPLLEIAAATNVTQINYPFSFALNSKLCLLMQAITPTCSVKAKNFAATLAEQDPPQPNGRLPDKYRWPGPGPPCLSKEVH